MTDDRAKMVNVRDLTPWAKNPRKNDPAVDAVADSIRRFGFASPILARVEDGRVIAGHTRLKAAIKLGMEAVPVRYLDLDDDAANALALADNKLGELAEWDDAALAEILRDLEQKSEPIDNLGWTTDELNALLDPPKKSDVEEDEVPDPPVEPITKPGDLWLLGNHRLMCGDSTKSQDVARLLDGRQIDICLTSPPYGAGRVAKLRQHIDSESEYEVNKSSFYDIHTDDPDSWPDLMDRWYDVWKPHSSSIICNVQMLADNKRPLIKWLAKRVDDFCDVVIWDKVNGAPQMANNVLTNAFEFCFIFGGNGSRSIPFANFHGTLSNILRLDPRGTNQFADHHRAVYPAKFAQWFMDTLCVNANTIADPFSGTGTTIIVAEQLGKTCYGMEISPNYCDIIVKRWEQLTGQTARRESEDE